MTDKPKTPAHRKAPEKSELERMTELTRRVIAVPKTEAVKPKRIHR